MKKNSPKSRSSLTRTISTPGVSSLPIMSSSCTTSVFTVAPVSALTPLLLRSFSSSESSVAYGTGFQRSVPGTRPYITGRQRRIQPRQIIQLETRRVRWNNAMRTHQDADMGLRASPDDKNERDCHAYDDANFDAPKYRENERESHHE